MQVRRQEHTVVGINELRGATRVGGAGELAPRVGRKRRSAVGPIDGGREVNGEVGLRRHRPGVGRDRHLGLAAVARLAGEHRPGKRSEAGAERRERDLVGDVDVALSVDGADDLVGLRRGGGRRRLDHRVLGIDLQCGEAFDLRVARASARIASVGRVARRPAGAGGVVAASRYQCRADHCEKAKETEVHKSDDSSADALSCDIVGASCVSHRTDSSRRVRVWRASSSGRRRRTRALHRVGGRLDLVAPFRLRVRLALSIHREGDEANGEAVTFGEIGIGAEMPVEMRLAGMARVSDARDGVAGLEVSAPPSP